MTWYLCLGVGVCVWGFLALPRDQNGRSYFGYLVLTGACLPYPVFRF